MVRIKIAATFALIFGIGALAGAQGGGFGGAQGSTQGRLQGRIQGFEGSLATYLNGDAIRSLLTPGEFIEWTMKKMKAGQVVIAESQSDAFDPAMEVVDDKGKIVAENDDRYPGDQRPLLLWRCDKDGDYALHVRSFRGKAGGQAFTRFKIYESVDLSDGAPVEAELANGTPFLLRVPVKAGQIKELVHDQSPAYMSCTYNATIAPGGLPQESPAIALRLQPAIYAVMEPVDGDYYIMETPYGNQPRGKVRIATHEVVPKVLALDGESGMVKAPTHSRAVWELKVRAGELLETSTPELDINSPFVVCEKPDLSKFDMSKPETNPFFPQANPPSQEPAVDFLPARARDRRLTVFRARRDTTLLLATNGEGRSNEFTLKVRPPAANFAEQTANAGKLKIAAYDYWAFDAKAGDVMSFKSAVNGFNDVIVVRDPELREVWHAEAQLDQTTSAWQMTVQQPGRYLVSVSCLGDGGGGDYSLSRTVYHAKEFSAGSPAKGEIAPGQTQVWKFTATPDHPLLVRWTSKDFNFGVSIYDDKGNATGFQREAVDPHNWVGILKVDGPRTFLIVLSGGTKTSDYTIELGKIPGVGS